MCLSVIFNQTQDVSSVWPATQFEARESDPQLSSRGLWITLCARASQVGDAAEIGHTGYFPNTQQHFEICSMKTQAGPW